jgi:ubiquitin-like 1-activating enzyme E1 B
MKSDSDFLFEESLSVVSQAKVLVVGSGGIGCELMKSLVVSGFKNISLIDLDQIEKSNLNRQFLFGKSDIGKNKSEMAKLNILKNRPDESLNISAFVGNIKDSKHFGTDFFTEFDIVLNALDNIDARTYVNRMCHILNIPLVNSGSEGYLGTVQTTIRNETPCYNCFGKNNTKSIPICTLRSKPEKIEHCVAWAKNLFEILYTSSDSSSFLVDEKLAENNEENLKRFFYLNLLEEKKVNHKIIPIHLEEILEQYQVIKTYKDIDDSIHIIDNEMFTLDFFVFFLIHSNRSLEKIVQNFGKFEKFDKENNDIINFIFSASNLRAQSFGISTNTRFKIKEIAGNIVPAIASTNAIVASMQTIEAIKVLMKRNDLLKNLHYNKSKEIKSSTAANEERNPDCIVCSKQENHIFLKINLGANSLKFLVEDICIKELSIIQPVICLEKNIIFDPTEEEQENLDLQLDSLINNNSILTISDENSDKKMKIIIQHQEHLKASEKVIEFSNLNSEIQPDVKKSEQFSEVKLKEIDENPVRNLIILESDTEDLCDLISEDEKSLGKKRKHEGSLETLEG